MEGKKQGTRGPSFTAQEDTAVAKAYIKTSEDPILGTDRKKKVFFESIVKVYNEVYKPANRPPRSYESVRNRVKLIIAKCKIFSSCYSRVLRINPSGYKEEDKLQMATGLYNGVKMNSIKDDAGESFRFLAAWEVLQNHPKFAAQVESVPDTTDSTLNKSGTESVEQQSESDNSSTENISVREVKAERPVGRKAAKAEYHKQKHYEAKLRIAKEALLLQKKRAEEIQRHKDIALFTSSGDLSPEAQEYFRISRKRVLEKLKNEEAENEEQSKKQRTAVFDSKPSPVSPECVAEDTSCASKI